MSDIIPIMVALGLPPFDNKEQEEQTKPIDTRNYCHCCGQGPREDIPLILDNCDIGVLSSIYEGFPVVLVEYGRAGLAVVATRVGECAEILKDGVAGILVPPSNPDALASAILRLLNSKELRSQLGKRLFERIKKNFKRRNHCKSGGSGL